MSNSLASSETAAPLLIYVHIPFCNSKCHFCDWVAQVPIGDLRLGPESQGRRDHLGAMKLQIEAQAPELAGSYRPEIMYWGGGTASILSCAEIEALHTALAGGFALDDITETTIEGSPESFTADKLRLLRDLGFNRVSIGVQSFNDDRLRMIGRAHTAAQAEASVELAREAGFDNINIDLIVGFPDQEISEVEATMERAVGLPVNHVSIYPYRASIGTALRRRLDRERRKTDLRNQLEAYGRAKDMLVENGFPEYTMAYFGSRPCLADLAYYQLSMDWIGFGSGSNTLIRRRSKGYDQGKLQRYIADPTTFDSDVPADSPAGAQHYIAVAMTTPEGMNADTLLERTGISLHEALEFPEVKSNLAAMREHGRITIDERGVRIHPDDIAKVFIAMNWIDDEQANTSPPTNDLGMPSIAVG